MRKRFAAIVIVGVFAMPNGISAQQPAAKKVTFQVTAKSSPDTGQIFIVGNQSELGGWQPGVVALEKQPDGAWRKSFVFPQGTHLEYKFTRGSWQNEAVTAENAIPPNAVLEVRGDTTVVVAIANWRDLVDVRVVGQITGTVRYHRQMRGEGILPRAVIVWLPPSYETAPQKRYPVLYMHDGQNIFDPKTSFLRVDWQVDEVADSLIRSEKMAEIIIVGVYNSDDRAADYSDTPKGRAYMKFLVETLKPFIDKNYRTVPGPESTATMGSSMGGLISFLIVWNYPEVFSQAGCLSPAFIGPYASAVDRVKNYQGAKKPIRLYLDNGGVDLDAELQPGCEAMVAALQAKGYQLGKDLAWFHAEQATHNEAAWAARVWRPLLFMFGMVRR